MLNGSTKVCSKRDDWESWSTGKHDDSEIVVCKKYYLKQDEQQQQLSKIKGTLLRNTKRCRRKFLAVNFLLKNFIAYRFKYDIL